ncbi:dephospho-CoA kinase [Crateriforma spongiae]|uniref:dephospho-CoA kinase n=1 Tax=Crateriforma spongiae TaxID=2724528 RepID=UPI0014478A1C|nr:dephospho-CoA kinase [Crateriforma spongiae]
MIILGLVGNPASGKSAVGEAVQQCGAPWINADLVAKEVLDAPPQRAALRQAFGDDVIASTGPIDRAKLAGQVFGDDPASVDRLRRLESIVHPATRQRIRQQLVDLAVDQTTMCVLEVPLMFESDWDVVCDAIWCVDAPWSRRCQWAEKRGWTPDELRHRQDKQLSIQQKARRSNWLIHNDGTLDDLRNRVARRLVQWSGRPSSDVTWPIEVSRWFDPASARCHFVRP